MLPRYLENNNTCVFVCNGKYIYLRNFRVVWLNIFYKFLFLELKNKIKTNSKGDFIEGDILYILFYEL